MKLPSLPLPLGLELVYSAPSSARAGVVELVDTGDSKSPAGNSLPVQVRPPVPIQAAEFKRYRKRHTFDSLDDRASQGEQDG